MDIRKFFGGGAGVKKGTAGQSANNNLTLQRNTTGKAKHGCSTFERQQTEQPVKSRKRTSSKSKSETNGDIEDSLIIDDSSDDDVIPCSLNSTPAQKIEKFDKSAVAPNFKRNDDITTNSKREVKSYHEKRKSTNGKDLKEDNLRRSPRKQQSVNVNSGKIFSSKKSKHIQISDDDDEVSRIGETSSEDNEDVTAPIKRRTGGNTKRGRKAVNVLDSESDDEDPVPQKIPQSKRKKKSVSLDNDSDEEKAQTPMDKFVKKKRSPVSKIETGVAKTEVPKSAQVNVSDFFGTGSASASRVERSVGEKRKRDNQGVGDKTDKMTVVFEEEIHDDEDFLKVLDELDGPKVKKVKLLQPKEDATTSKGSLASRLSNKMKAKPNEESVLMKEATLTPLKKISSPQKSSALQKRKSSYTLEDTAPKSSFPKTAKVDKKGGNKTPEKSASVPKALMYSGKKDTDKEDDGFGTKKTGGFRAFKMRGGPLALGSKEIPEGAENCLEGMAFVVTGVLDSIERDDAKSMVEKYGGKVTTSLSKKTSYLVVGREPGESKLVKAKDLKVMQIDEDGLFDLVKTLPGKTSKYEVQAKQQLKQEESFKLKSEKERSTSLKKLQSFQSDKANDAPSSSSTVKQLFTKLRSSDEKHPSNMVKNEMEQQQESRDASIHEKPPESLLWVDKHKPNTMKQIIGQQGDKSNAHKLLYWIKHWYDNIIIKGTKTSGNYFGKGSGDGTGFRAALLSGPPGIGKTTTATLVCKEAGFSYVELNASDTRSKRSLKEVIAESLNNQTLVDFVGDEQKKGQQRSLHHCLIMDEVDGMAGNEDRGGLQELVQLIRNTKIPILCICNDRNSMKMRTLSNYCFDLRFQRPRVEQIKGAMMTLAFREGVKIPPSAVQEIILAANHDIRQVIHNLSMWTATEKNLTFEQVKEDAQKAQKDLKLGPFDVCRKVFVSDETKKMSINDKSDLFFHDYSFAPLFVHENYPHVIPTRAEGKKSKHMACLAHTIDSLCDGDLVEKLIRNGGNWNLLPIQAMYSSVLPGEYMRGSFPQMTNFPLWLGKNSTTGKTDRILQELGMHMGLKISCDKRGLNQDYIPALRTCLTAPLASHGNDGVPGVIQVMDDYDIIKDDFDNILEVSKWPNSMDYMTQVESKTKAALTRMYNKSGHMTPYSSGMGGKKKGKGRAVADGDDNLLREEYDGEAVAESEEEEDEPVIVSKPKGKTAKSKQNIGEKNKGKSGGGKGRK